MHKRISERLLVLEIKDVFKEEKIIGAGMAKGHRRQLEELPMPKVETL